MSTILIVDDNEINLILFRFNLKNMDINILEAKNGKEAVETYKANPDICLVLMDILMPVVSGIEAAKIIKEINPKIIIISQTALHSPDSIKTENFDYHITKPINFKDLKKLINKLCFEQN